MSAKSSPEDVIFYQRLLRLDGLYPGPLSGEWDDATEQAAVSFERESKAIRESSRTFDTRSERNIHGLSLRAQREARSFLGRLLDAGHRASILSGTRTYAEQDRLFAQGRFGNPGAIVTKAEGGHSNHNFGIAWDVGLFTASGAYIQTDPEYQAASAAGKGPMLEWGGDWKTFRDFPHYQLKVKTTTIAELRQQFEGGTAQQIFAA